MKKSHIKNQTNIKSAQSAQQAKVQIRARVRAGIKIRSFILSLTSITSCHFRALFRISIPAAKSTSARHFRANSYVPLLLALRPRAGGSGRLDKPTKLVRPGRLAGLAKLSKLGKLTTPAMGALGLICSLCGAAAFISGNVAATSITLSIPSTPLSVQVSPGKFAKSEAQSISVSTDGTYGYTLKVSSKNGNTLDNGASKINPITSSLSETQFSASSDNNVWGFLPSKLNSQENTNFIAGPAEGPITLDETKVSNPDAANEYQITLGAKVDSTLPAGTYSNTFTFTATANALDYTITYDAHAGDATGAPEKQSGSTLSGADVVLSEQTPTRPGYVFQGWCDIAPTVDASGSRDTCGGENYKAGTQFPVEPTKPSVTLYAMWNELLLTDVIEPETGKPITFKVGDGIELVMVASSKQETQQPPLHPEQTTTTKWWPFYAIKDTPVTMDPPEAGEKFLITVVPQKNNKFIKWQKNNDSTEWTAVGATGSYKTMQELTQAGCTAAGAGGMNVTDTRNNVSYTVGIVSNGADFSRCWMYSNLRLEGGTHLDSTASDLRAEETFDVPDNTKASAEVAGGEDIYEGYWAKKDMIECKGGVSEKIIPFEVDGSYDGSDRNCANNPSVTTEFYYNWYSAIANDAVGDTLDDPNSATEDKDKQAKGSICPKNWRLTQEGEAGDENSITSTDEIFALAAAHNAASNDNLGRLAATGSFWGARQHYVGMYGHWWSASRCSDGKDYYGNLLFLDYNGARLNENNKGVGKSVRCILRDE